MVSDEQQIRELVATWMAATKAGDLDTVLSLMADDVVFLVSGQPPMIGKSAFAAAAAGQQAHSVQIDGVSDIQEITVTGDWAYMWTSLRVRVTPPAGAPAVTRAGYTLSILKKQNGRWLLARDANLLSPVAGE